MLLVILKTPWIASPRWSRWLALMVMAICIAFIVPAAVGLHGREALVPCGLLWCLALAAWWLLVAGNASLVAHSATMLRLPGLQRVANVSLLVNGLLTVLLPAWVLSALFGHGLLWLVGFALVAAVCMLFLLLPLGVMVAACIGFSISLQFVAHLKALSLDSLSVDLMVPALVCIALAAWQWSRLVEHESPTALGHNVPLIWNLRMQSLHGLDVTHVSADAVLARGSHPWLAPTPNLRGLGPARPARSIRLALGRTVMPRTTASTLRQMVFSIAIVALGVGLPMVAHPSDHEARQILITLFLPHPGGFALPLIIACAMVAAGLGLAMTIQSRWTVSAAELPMLALLPGLGNTQATRRNVVRACLTQTLHATGIEFVVLCALGLWAHAFVGTVLFAGLCVACTLGLSAACILCALGGRPLSGWTLAVLTMGLLILNAFAMWAGSAYAWFNAQAWPPLILALLLMLALLASLCRRGWYALQRRPHPFLANAR